MHAHFVYCIHVLHNAASARGLRLRFSLQQWWAYFNVLWNKSTNDIECDGVELCIAITAFSAFDVRRRTASSSHNDTHCHRCQCIWYTSSFHVHSMMIISFIISDVFCARGCVPLTCAEPLRCDAVRCAVRKRWLRKCSQAIVNKSTDFDEQSHNKCLNEMEIGYKNKNNSQVGHERRMKTTTITLDPPLCDLLVRLAICADEREHGCVCVCV